MAARRSIPSLPLRRVLDVLCANVDENGRKPLVRLGLASGREVSGRVESVFTADVEATLLMTELGQCREPGKGMLYVRVASIESLFVEDVAHVVAPLSGGRVDPLDLVPVPGSAEFSRRIGDLVDKLHELFAARIEIEIGSLAIDAPHRRAVAAEVLDLIEQVFVDLAGDEEARETIEQLLDEIQVEDDEKAVRLEGGTLVIALPVDSGPEERMSAAELRRAVERVLAHPRPSEPAPLGG